MSDGQNLNSQVNSNFQKVSSESQQHLGKKEQAKLDLEARITELENETGFLYHEIDLKDQKISELQAEIEKLNNRQPDQLLESKYSYTFITFF